MDLINNKYKLHDESLCSNPKCECHTDASKKVLTPFPIELGNPYCCPHCAIRRYIIGQDNDLITVDWLLSIGATSAVLSKEAKPGCTTIEQYKNKDWYVVRAHFKGTDWYFRFGGDEPIELGVGELIEINKEVPHITTKDQFRALYELLENKKLVE